MIKKKVSLFVLACVVMAMFSSTAEARGWRRWRSSSYSYSSNTSVSMTFTGDAQSVCEQKAALQASRCSMFHPGGSFGGGSCEGVGCAGDPDTALSICCYSNSGRTLIGQAVVRGANGMYYACRIFR